MTGTPASAVPSRTVPTWRSTLTGRSGAGEGADETTRAGLVVRAGSAAWAKPPASRAATPATEAVLISRAREPRAVREGREVRRVERLVVMAGPLLGFGDRFEPRTPPRDPRLHALP